MVFNDSRVFTKTVLDSNLTSFSTSSVAVIGGGINGIMSAWALAQAGAKVTVFESQKLVSQTSRVSTKMLHGGLRYLANYEFSMVRESLQERRWWVSQDTGLVKPVAIVVPIRKGNLLRQLVVGIGIKLYDLLATGSGFPRSRWLKPAELAARFPDLRVERLSGGWEYWDAQMDDYALGLWAAQQARSAGVQFIEQAAVKRITIDGQLELRDQQGKSHQFDCIVNAAGPWAEALLDASGITHQHGLTLIRGTHLLINQMPSTGLALPHDRRRLIFFLPYQSAGLLGTTEKSQSINDPISATDEEIRELKLCYDEWFGKPMAKEDVREVFTGLRPIVHQRDKSLTQASREAVLERQGRVVTIWGGKWTTSRQLGLSVASTCKSVLMAH